MVNVLTSKCECEHEAHFGDGNTPNGNHGHKYGVYFAHHYIVPVKTAYGTFNVCKDCAGDCYSDENLTTNGLK